MVSVDEARRELARRELVRRQQAAQMEAAPGEVAQASVSNPSALRQLLGAADDMARIGANAITLGGADRVAGLLGGRGTEAERELTTQARERAGLAGLGADIVGAVALPFGLARQGLTMIGRGAPAAMRGLRGVAARTGVAGAEGAGYGVADALINDRNVGQEAATSAAFGSFGNRVGEGVQALLNRRAVRQAVPTVEQLRTSASELYDAARASGVRATQPQTQQLAQDMRAVAAQEGLISPTGRISEAYPRAREAINLLDDYALGEMTVPQMQTVRKVLSDAAAAPDAAERRIASIMLRQFDDFTATLAPELQQARGLYQRAMKGEELERMRDLGEIRASQFSNSGTENALRTEYRQLDRRIARGTERGWSPAEIEAIQRVSRGTPTQRAARNIGRLAPTGPVSFGMSTGVPFMIGNAVGGPGLGGAAAAGTAGLGFLGRSAAEGIQRRNIEMAEMLARSGGLLPVVDDRAVREAIARALIGGSNVTPERGRTQ